MGGSSVEVGRHYELAWHDGLCLGPINAYLGLEAGTKMAFRGRIEASGLVVINQPDLWGGEKDQGGVVGNLRLMFGDADQVPNDYLVSVFGDKTVAWRGVATVCFEGGRWGANNPYQMKRSHFVERTTAGWDDEPWYPETCSIPLGDDEPGEFNTLVPFSAGGWKYLVTDPAQFDWDAPAATDYDDTSWETGAGGFGSADLAGMSASTFVPSGLNGRGIWLRRHFSAVPGQPIKFDLWHDDGVWVWLNGELVTLTGTDNYYHDTATVSGALVHANNVVAVKVLDGIPDGSPANIFAGVDISQQERTGVYGKNPAHIILEQYTQSYGGGLPIEHLNLDSFTAAADWYFEQGFGLGTARRSDRESPAEYIARIERVAGCSFSQSPEDGLWYLDIANGEYVLEDLPILTDHDVLEFEEIPTVLDNAINSVSVKYTDPLRNEDITTRPLQALALIAEFGENHQAFDFSEIPSAAIAGRVQMRELLATTTPTRAFNLVTTPKTRSWRKNTYFRAQLPKRGIVDMVCLVAEGDDGKLKSGACQFKATQDVYSLPATVYAGVEPGIDPNAPLDPAPNTAETVFEAPYINVVAQLSPTEFAALAPDAGFVVGVAANPGGMLDFRMAVDAGAGYQDNATGDYCPTCLSTAEVGPLQKTSIAISSAVRLAQVAVGDLVLWDTELCRVDDKDLDAGLLALGRACGDTTPERHFAGSRMYFYMSGAAVDPIEYIEGETINVKLRSNTGTRVLPLADATEHEVTMARRFDRPYPPANLMINGVSPFDIGSGGGVPAGAGSGGGGGGSISPQLTPDRLPGSTEPGANGGYADDANESLPFPSVFDTELVTGGDFSDPGDIAGFTNTSPTPAYNKWYIEDGALWWRGTTEGTTTYEPARYTVPVQQFPRYIAHVSGTVQTFGGGQAALGMGMSNESAPAEYIEPTLVSYDYAWAPTARRLTGYVSAAALFHALPPSVGGEYRVKFDDVSIEIEQVVVPVTLQSFSNIDFSSGMTDWIELTGTGDFSVDGDELVFAPTGDNIGRIYLDEVATLADAAFKYVRLRYKVWCDDPDARNGAVGGTYSDSGLDFGPYQRGDWTQREEWYLCRSASGTTKPAIACRCGIGYEVRVKDIEVHVTDDPVT